MEVEEPALAAVDAQELLGRLHRIHVGAVLGQRRIAPAHLRPAGAADRARVEVESLVEAK